MKAPLMTRLITTLLVGLGVSLFALYVAAGEPARANLVVEVDKPGARISPMLWGIFFEEINCAGDGGLYAELIRNRSFEDSAQPEHWRLVTHGSAKGEMAVDSTQPMSPLNPRSLRLTASGGPGRVSLVNEGYWGIALKTGAEYRLSLFARAQKPPARLVATLEDAKGKTYAEGAVEGIGGDWKRFELLLRSQGTDPAARLVLSVSEPGTIWLDMVSLFPAETFKGRPNGLRPDLAQMLLALRPSFVRFPGGCWVEGDTLEFALRWKRTIGELSERRTQWNLWQYHSTNGLGFHEYLQMCEDLGAEPLFVINCGMSHRENVPMDQMAEWVQDALDAIEYANGPVESKWGSLRAKHGHPAPFGLKYLEIGNENGGPAYQERYALFYDAVKARFPKIQLIADCPTTKRPADIVDEHYYSTPEFFMLNADRYDRYDRKGPKVYVGEYAVTANCGKGNLRGALGEAAFMTGMERNADIVVMASYAPLFCNVNYQRWPVNMINFDSHRVYGNPSYYVQQMFSQHRADVVLPVSIQATYREPAKVRSGAIGLATWSTQAEFKDIQVTRGQQVLFQSDFAQGTTGWQIHSGQWQVKQGALQQTGRGTDLRAVAGDTRWSDYTYTLKARKLGGAEGFLIMFQVRDQNNWLWWNLGGWGNVRHAIERCQNGAKSILGPAVPGRIETGRWYDIRIELHGETIRCYLDGRLIHDVSHQPTQPMYAVAGLAQRSGEVILKVVNTCPADQDTLIELRGSKRVEASAEAVVLTSAKAEDENTLQEPTKVSPKTSTIRGVGPSFRHTFPAYSLTVLRLKLR